MRSRPGPERRWRHARRRADPFWAAGVGRHPSPADPSWPPSAVTASTIVTPRGADGHKLPDPGSTPRDVPPHHADVLRPRAHSASICAGIQPLVPTPRRGCGPRLRSSSMICASDRRIPHDNHGFRAIGDGLATRPSMSMCLCPRWRSSRASSPAHHPQQPRVSSSRGTKSGSRWPSTGAAMARITRGEIRLGPGPSRIRSVDGSDNGMDSTVNLSV